MTEATKKTESAGTTASRKPVGKVADTTSNKASNKASKNTAAKLAMNGSASPILLPEGYRPSEEEEFMNSEEEEFMNPLQLLYFRKKLEAWRAELLDEASDTITGLSQENLHQPDQMDRAQIESNAALDLRTRDRERKLLQKIESALRRIDEGSYGYCVETDEPINLRRLEARPIASLSLHAQERHERMERVHRDD
jgi:DnaK suppressor protein